MPSLGSILSTASQSLMAQEAALSVTNNNIANANTTGYARQTATLAEANPTSTGTISLGNGVTLTGISSVRDELLSLQIQQQTSAQSSADAQVSALTQVETLFPSTGTSLSSSLSAFFTNLSALSANPTSTADRQTVLSSAQTVVNQFNSISAGLTGPTSGLNTTVTNDVSQINQLTGQAATLNQEILQQNAAGQSSGTLSDKLNQVELQLAGITNISVTHTDAGDNITTGNGTPLVLGNQAYQLSTQTGTGGAVQVLDSSGTNITSNITGGDLGGTIQVRDTVLPGLSSSLDALANQFATTFNTANEAGYDQDGTKGSAIFTAGSATTISAATITLGTSDPTAIAASSDGTSGSNGNVAALTALQTSAPAGGQSVTSLSSSLIYQVGNLTSNATANSAAVTLSLTSLNTQQASVSGVSIDEESANLVRFQQAYEASAKVITTIASLFDTTINMFSGS
jgi:flagellar hook-associated protein 1 FlgK